MKRVKRTRLPKGWHRGTPKKAGTYKTSREACIQDGKVYGNGYAQFAKGQWRRLGTWGNHYTCNDFIWSLGSP